MSKPMTQLPPPVVYGDTAHAMLETILDGLRLLGPAMDVYGRFPTLYVASLRLTWLITKEPEYPPTERPILAHCLEEAIRAAGVARSNGHDVRHAYLQALLTTACMLLEVDVRSRRERWDPLFDEGLATWYPERGAIHINPHPAREIPLASPANFFTGLALRIVDPADLSEIDLRMNPHEAAA